MKQNTKTVISNSIRNIIILFLLQINLFAITDMGNNFYLADNEVTITCKDAEVGDTTTYNDITYTKIGSKDDLVIYDGDVEADTACTTDITDMSEMFKNKNDFNKNINHWDTSNVTSMYYMFSRVDAFNQDIGDWDTSNVTDMSSMFYSADAFNQDIGDWNTSNVTSMYRMFSQADAFNQDISKWCVINITSKPNSFDFNSNSIFKLNSDLQPKWGTCPVDSQKISNQNIKIDTNITLNTG